MDRKRRAVSSWISSFPIPIAFAIPMGISLGIFLAFLVGCNHQIGFKGPIHEQIRPATDTARLVKNADYLKKSGRIELAVKELEEAHLQDPGNLKILDVLTQCYEELGHFDRAQELYTKALARVGHHPALENNRCYSFFLQGRLGQAEACFRKILARQPDNQTARNNLGLVLCRQERETEALALWRETLSDVEARQRLGQVLATLGREVPPSLAGSPLIAAVKSSQAPNERTKSKENQPAAPASHLALPVPANQAPAAPIAASPPPPEPKTPEVAAEVPQSLSIPESQAPVTAKATTPPPSAVASLKTTIAPPTSGNEISQGSSQTTKPIALEGSTTPAAAVAIPDPSQSSLPEKSVAGTSPSASEPASTSKIEAKQVPPTSASCSTTPEPQPTMAAVPTPPVAGAASPPEVKKESVTPAQKPSFNTNTQASTSITPARDIQGKERFPRLKQLVTRFLALIRQDKAAFQASSVNKDTQTSTPSQAVDALHQTQASAAPKGNVADSQAKRKEGAAAAHTPSSIKKAITTAASTARPPAKEAQATQLAVPPAKVAVQASLPDKKEEGAAPIPNPSNNGTTQALPEVLTANELRLKIELKNGNGVQNQARQTRKLLWLEGFQVIGIGNHINFGLKQTVIVYRSEAARVAQVLAQKYFPGASLEQDGNLSRTVDIRVSLGQDQVSNLGNLAQITP